MGRRGAKQTPAALESAVQLAERLAPLGDVTVRKMFGGCGVFESGTMFALVTSEGECYLKVDDDNRELFDTAGSKPFGRMPYYEIPLRVLSDIDTLREWAATSLAASKK